MKQIDRIRKFSGASGPSGFEDAVVVYAREKVHEICTCKGGHMRNLYMNLRRNNQGGVNIMLDAHSDEVGFIVRAVKGSGFLRFLSLGGWDVKNIIVSRVLTKNRDSKLIPGIVCSKPVHFMNASEQGKVLDFADVSIDVGATSAQEVQESFRIGIGVSIAPDITRTYDEEHKTFMGKAFDNRIGYAAVVEVLCRLHGRTFTNTVSATLSSQEKVGERGMTYVMNNARPDVMICLEGCPTDNSFEGEYITQSALKKGSMLRHFDRSMTTSPRFQRFTLELAYINDIPVQESVRKGGGTNGGIIHTARFGILTIAVDVPVCYACSSYKILVYRDYEHAVELAVQVVEGLSKDIAESF